MLFWNQPDAGGSDHLKGKEMGLQILKKNQMVLYLMFLIMRIC